MVLRAQYGDHHDLKRVKRHRHRHGRCRCLQYKALYASLETQPIIHHLHVKCLEVLDQTKVWNKCCFGLLKKEKMRKSRKTGIPIRSQWMNNDHQETRTLSRQFEESGHQYTFLADVRQAAELNINNPHMASWMIHPLTTTKNMESCSIQFYSILLCSFYLQTVVATTTINLWILTKGFDDLFSKIKDTIV
eukprot:scaffold6322_cov59-Cylindrotheca_fusiformis.AAC.9